MVRFLTLTVITSNFPELWVIEKIQDHDGTQTHTQTIGIQIALTMITTQPTLPLKDGTDH